MENKWLVSIKGKANADNFEISIVRDSNKHGQRSYGWFGEDKKLIASSGGPCRESVDKYVWDRHIETAEQYAMILNGEELSKWGYGDTVLGTKTALDMLDNPPEPNDKLKEILELK